MWPLVSAIYLLALGIYDLPQLGMASDSLGIGLILIGLIPAVLAKRKGVDFFRRVSLDLTEMEHINISD